MDFEATCPYCKKVSVFTAYAGPKDLKGSSTQTCPHCGANIETQLLLALKAGGFGSDVPRPRRSLHSR